MGGERCAHVSGICTSMMLVSTLRRPLQVARNVPSKLNLSAALAACVLVLRERASHRYMLCEAGRG